MNIRSLNHRQVCILGYGQEGRATYAALKHYAPQCHITIADANPATSGEPGCQLVSGPDYLDKLANFDVIIKTPGLGWYPPKPLADKLTSATELFLDSLPKNTRVVGVTGTKGKSTTAHFIHQALQAGGLESYLAGNIGDPMLGYLPRATAATIFVLELSSYQLENLRTSPDIAVITSFFPDHLDRHGNLEAYFTAKQHIAQFQTASDIVFYNALYPECRAIAELSPGQKVPFEANDFPGRPAGARRGSQNMSNLAAAYKVACYLGVNSSTALTALKNATSLPDRQESLGVHHGIEWVNDSAATTPQSTLAALEAFGDTIGTIIVGGLDRGYDFTSLGHQLAQANIPNIVLFPDTGANIRQAIEATPGSHAKTYFETADMEQAVAFALRHTAPGKICLLSNGSPSYNLFKNYPDRARAFKAAIAKLA